MRYVFFLLLPLVVALPVGAENDPAVPFPEGWRDWFHVKSMVIEPGHPLYAPFGGIHHIQANELVLCLPCTKTGFRPCLQPDP